LILSACAMDGHFSALGGRAFLVMSPSILWYRLLYVVRFVLHCYATHWYVCQYVDSVDWFYHRTWRPGFLSGTTVKTVCIGFWVCISSATLASAAVLTPCLRAAVVFRLLGCPLSCIVSLHDAFHLWWEVLC
jgi:hypothetical protein